AKRRASAIAASTAVAAIAATAATTTAAAAAAAVPPAAAATTEAAATTATPAGLALASLVDGQGAAVERLAVQLADRGLRVLLAAELDECETARLTGHAIGHDADADHFAPTGGARFTKSSFVRVIRQISDLNASSHFRSRVPS